MRLTANPDVADPNSEQVVLSVAQPYSNHNGGQLAFGPNDGYLYIGMGDGGSGGDPENRAQNPAELLGKMLRIDVETGSPVTYTVPATNPFLGTPAYRGEIWALGLRNPWRFAFDRLTGDLYIGDVGQNQYEEVDFQPASSAGGENYGWRIMEGFHCYNPANCQTTGLTLPVVEYDHGQGCSITGGVVYRGAQYGRMQWALSLCGLLQRKDLGPPSRGERLAEPLALRCAFHHCHIWRGRGRRELRRRLLWRGRVSDDGYGRAVKQSGCRELCLSSRVMSCV